MPRRCIVSVGVKLHDFDVENKPASSADNIQASVPITQAEDYGV
jgi:hypothetical protein